MLRVLDPRGHGGLRPAQVCARHAIPQRAAGAGGGSSARDCAACSARLTARAARTACREGTRAELAECLGLLPPAPIRAVLYPLLITATLFACPLALRVQTKGSLLSPGMRSWAQAVALAARAGDMRALWHALSLSFAAHNLWLWRNLVVAPLSEEWVFRACMAPVLLNQVTRWCAPACHRLSPPPCAHTPCP